LHTENVFGGENFEALGKKGRGPPWGRIAFLSSPLFHWKVALNTLVKELAEVTEDMGEF
jgi:hypothetical protein